MLIISEETETWTQSILRKSDNATEQGQSWKIMRPRAMQKKKKKAFYLKYIYIYISKLKNLS